MPLTTTAVSTATEYIFTVTDGTEENTFRYCFGKELPLNNEKDKQSLTVQEYLQNCKREAELLAQLEIDRKAPPQEIVI